jgi:putative redox protein
MAEKVIIRQNDKFENEIQSFTSEETGGEPQLGEALTPYGMLLSGLGACTAIILHTYAQNHALKLHEVTIEVTYDRSFPKDCENCETTDRYEETITESITLAGDLTQADRDKLLRIPHHCPIYKMLQHGIPVRSQLAA